MDQELNTPKPTIQQQIEFVRGARHMVYNEKRVVEIDHRHHLMLQEIEENLISVQLFNQAQSVTVPATRAEPQTTAAATSFGKTNMYVCDRNHQTVTIDRVEGTTPFIIACPTCKTFFNEQRDAQSRMYRVSQGLNPTHEFYKPTAEELEKLKTECSTHSYYNLRQHVDQGGLLLRKIEEVSHA
jgi:hypothetical protein